jgi:hypothetical protein
MYDIIHDRVFWIYFIITLFFVIIGLAAIINSNNSHLLIIAAFWLLSNVALLILIYHASIIWGPSNDQDPICVLDSDSGCFKSNNRMWLFINILFIVMLILSTLWAGELENTDSNTLSGMSGVLILLGGLVLGGLLSDHEIMSNVFIAPFWIAIGYLLVWFGLTLYAVIQ